MWEKLTTYRRRFFGVYDQTAQTIEISLAQIVAAKNPNRRIDPADVKFQQEKIKLRREMEEAERELRAKERKEAEEKRRLELLAEDRPMKLAWQALEASIGTFAETEFTIGEEWERREARDVLYQLYDAALEESRKYWSKRDAKERTLAEGTEEDHDAMFADFMATVEGNHERDLLVIEKLLTLLLERYKPQSQARMTGAETQRLSNISDAQESVTHLKRCLMKQHEEVRRKAANYAAMIEEKVEVDRKVDHDLELVVHNQSLKGYFAVAKKYAKWKDITEVEGQINAELKKRLHDEAVQKLEWEIARSTEERRRMQVMKEFKIITDFGSRKTHWEFVFDPDQMRHVFVNTDTMQVAHEKTAICHECDAVFAQSDLRCADCDAPRSAKNLKLYRPLGFKELVPD